jgi:carboxyl-terminal processing protease
MRKELGLALDPLADDSSDDGLTGNERDIVKDAAREKAAEKRRTRCCASRPRSWPTR